MGWNNAQLNAINVRNKNILVSAGAGSGKTAVLTERVIELLKEGIDLDELLILTFTKDAASEMRIRIRNKINESNDENVKKALDKIDTAKIMTFDAYSLSLVKKYSYVLGVDKNIKVAGNTYIINSIASKILDDILKELYQSNDQELIDYFSFSPSKDDEKLKTYIIDITNKLMLLPNVDEYFEYYVNNYQAISENIMHEYKKVYAQFAIETYKYWIPYLFNKIKKLMEMKAHYVSSYSATGQEILQKINNYIEPDDNLTLDEVRQLYNDTLSIKGYTDTKKAKFENEDVLTIIDQINEVIKEIISIKKSYFNTGSCYTNDFKNEEDMHSNLEFNLKYSKFYIRIIKQLLEKLDSFKEKMNYFQFIDIAKMAIELVSKHEDIRNEIKYNLKEILIDEYQDTSDLQEIFINYISNNNVYQVGDIKQSIYRFRNANPNLFKNKYNTYTNYTKDTKEQSVKIDLLMNYRSRIEVLKAIDVVFDKLMTDEFGDANYEKEHQMQYGLVQYSDLSNTNEKAGMKIIEYEFDSSSDEEKSESDIEAESYKTTELELFYIANDISEKIKNKTKIYDKDEKIMRDATYKDFCILIDRAECFETAKKILEFNNIPCAINASKDIKKSIISDTILSLLNLVTLDYQKEYNEKYYHALMSVGRSFMFDYSDSELFNLINNCKANKYHMSEPISNVISNKIREISPNINKYSNKDIYYSLIEKFNVINRLRMIGNIEENLIILEYFANMINEFSSLGYNLIDIVDLLSETFKINAKLEYEVDIQGLNAVRIMTIHKSKGLEFPIIYYPSMIKKQNEQEYKKLIGFNYEYGFYFGNEYDKSIIAKLNRYKGELKDLSERIRLFYVALTRAREEIQIITPKISPDNRCGLIDAKSFYDFLCYVNSDDLDKYKETMDFSKLNLNHEYEYNSQSLNINYVEKPQYDDKSYYGNSIEKTNISKLISTILSDKERNNIKTGVMLHKAMEYLDFSNPNIDNIKDPQIRKTIKNLLTDCDLFKKISNAKTYHEHEFIMNCDSKEYKGIIDLLVVYDDHIDIIDYKLNNIDDEAYDRQVLIYKQYVSMKFNKPIHCYLLSLSQNKYREVV